ncbi:hypothetical protein Rt10032_c18g6036 [Rhodotorula toruloides]|uniref:F-box domain-containing protein n=1 Tax=Rhodotorula toruloides TaxID=5286 RepID=A0A511KNS5_RHOTO|nr:hypothetical protein Rt10032_c18g6036 [Rhodotorula toruloides]
MPAARRAYRASTAAISYAEASGDEEEGALAGGQVQRAETAKGGKRAREAAVDEHGGESGDEGDEEEKANDGTDAASDDDDAEWGVKTKRRKGTARGKKGRRPSGPDLVTKLPVDALTEIVSFLPHGTLVQLRLVCKAFYRLLTDETSGTVI